MYATPYTALLSELGHNPKERLLLSTIISITWAIGFAVGNQIYLFQKLFQDTGLSATQAFQTVIIIFSVIAAVLMYLPVIFINERKYAEPHVSNEGVLKALGSTLKNKHFFTFISAEVFYFICLNIINAGMVYFIATLLQLPKETVSFLSLIMFACSFLFYVPVYFLGSRLGKKRLLVVGFVVFCAVFALCALMGILPLAPMTYAYIVVGLAAIPLAIFGILPNAVVADIAEADGIKSGNYKAGIYFGVRTFEMNIGVAIANGLFPSFLAIGKSVENPIGIRLAAAAASLFCIVGLAIFLRYREKDITAVLATKEVV
jgi:Na+/melibiose symporter-like transporter